MPRISVTRACVDDRRDGDFVGRSIACARISTWEQDLKLQPDANKKHGVPRDFIGVEGGASEVEGMSCRIKPGDILLVWRLN